MNSSNDYFDRRIDSILKKDKEKHTITINISDETAAILILCNIVFTSMVLPLIYCFC